MLCYVKKAFEKYKPRGLFSEFYGNVQVTYITSPLPAWVIFITLNNDRVISRLQNYTC